MYSATQQSDRFQTTDQDCKRIIAELMAQVKPQQREVIIPAFQALDTQDSLYLLREGTVSYLRNGKVLFHLDDGDIVGIEERDSTEEAQISSKFAVIVDQYDKQKFVDQVIAKPELQQLWSTFLSKQLALYVSIISSLFKNVIESEPCIKHYQANEMIVEEGSETNLIYTIVQGHANVFRDGVNIGTVGSDQIFGSYSALSGTKLAASVVAAGRALVLSIERAEFLEMLQNKRLDHLSIFNKSSDLVII